MKRSLKPLPNGGIAAHQIACLEQKVEKVESTGALLELFITLDRGAQLLLKSRRKIGVRRHPELIEMAAKTLESSEHGVAGHARAVTGATAMPRLGEVSIPGKVDEPCLPPVVIRVTEGLMKSNLLTQMPCGSGVEKQVVLRVGRLHRESGKRVKLGDHPVDVTVAVEGSTSPGSCEIAPLRQLPGGAPHAVNRSIFARRPVVPGPHGPSKRTPDPFGGMSELRLNPTGERLVEQTFRLPFSENGEQRIDVRFYRTLSKQLRTESVDRADVRFFESREGIVEPLLHLARGTGPFAFQCLAQAELQLARGLLREGHRDDVADLGRAGGKNPEDAFDELGCLSGPCGCFDNHGFVERVRDGVPGVLVGKSHFHRPPPWENTEAQSTQSFFLTKRAL